MARKKVGEGGDGERIEARSPNVTGRAEERRRQILDAAATVFARRGYHRTRVQEIADEAGLAVGTIYIYYASKRDLLLALTQHVVLRSMPEMLAHLQADKPQEWLQAVLRERLAMLDDNRDLIRAVTPEMITHADLQQAYLRQVLVPFLRQFSPLWQRSHLSARLRPFDSRIVLPAIVGAVIASFVAAENADLLGMKPCSREEIVVEVASLFLDGLLSREGPAGPRPAPGGDGHGEAALAP